MRKIIIFVLTVSCNFNNNIRKNEIQEQSPWRMVNIELNQTLSKFQGNIVCSLSRSSTSNPSYVSVKASGNVKKDKKFHFKVSIIVKKEAGNGLFGMRISSLYKDRVDAVFNLEEGLIKGVEKVGKYTNEKAAIESIADGWYKCSLYGLAINDNVEILFGVSNNTKRITAWEGKASSLGSVYILPNSLKFEQIVE